ncbi:unnamed protein product, partial [Amoebophrya sp. A25]
DQEQLDEAHVRLRLALLRSPEPEDEEIAETFEEIENQYYELLRKQRGGNGNAVVEDHNSGNSSSKTKTSRSTALGSFNILRGREVTSREKVTPDGEEQDHLYSSSSEIVEMFGSLSPVHQNEESTHLLQDGAILTPRERDLNGLHQAGLGEHQVEDKNE